MVKQFMIQEMCRNSKLE